MYNIELTLLNTEKLFNAAQFGNLDKRNLMAWPGLDSGLDWSGLAELLNLRNGQSLVLVRQFR